MNNPGEPRELPGESLADFKDSFSYGSRSDLTFKFLKRLPESEAAEFLREVLLEIGEQLDGGPPEHLIDLVTEWQARAYRPEPGARTPYVYEDRPFTPLPRGLDEMEIGLVTSSGHYVRGDEPRLVADQTQEEVATRIRDFLRETPELSEIPRDTPATTLEVRHPGYDIRSASRDAGVSFPRDALIGAAADGRIGGVADVLYSFVGACSQGRLRKELPGWVETWKSAGLEALFLVPV